MQRCRIAYFRLLLVLLLIGAAGRATYAQATYTPSPISERFRVAIIATLTALTNPVRPSVMPQMRREPLGGSSGKTV
jgi:hypothetical protein